MLDANMATRLASNAAWSWASSASMLHTVSLEMDRRALKAEFLFSRCGAALADAAVLDIRGLNLGRSAAVFWFDRANASAVVRWVL